MPMCDFCKSFLEYEDDGDDEFEFYGRCMETGEEIVDPLYYCEKFHCCLAPSINSSENGCKK